MVFNEDLNPRVAKKAPGNELRIQPTGVRCVRNRAFPLLELLDNR